MIDAIYVDVLKRKHQQPIIIFEGIRMTLFTRIVISIYIWQTLKTTNGSTQLRILPFFNLPHYSLIDIYLLLNTW